MHRGIWLTAGILIAAFALAMLWSSPDTAQVGLAAPLPTSPPPTWTPGPPPEKIAAPPSEAPEAGKGASGALTLHVHCTTDATACQEALRVLWTQVEAQNADGSWSPVPGWGGGLSQIDGAQGQLSWWYGTQALPPLRWTISKGPGGELVTLSDSFQPMPNGSMVVNVSLPNAPVLLPASGRGIAFAVGGLATVIGLCLVLIARLKAIATP